MKRLRGTKLDPFGRAEVLVERELIREYEDTIAEVLALLTPDTHATARELLEPPGRDPRLRGDQAPQCGALPQAAEAIMKRLRRRKPAPQVLELGG